MSGVKIAGFLVVLLVAVLVSQHSMIFPARGYSQLAAVCT